MPTRITELAYDAADIGLLARFWSDLLGWPITQESDDEVDIEPPDEYALPEGIAFGPVPEPKTGKNRLHLDLASSSPEHQNEIVTKALDLGARRADIGQGDVPWAVLTDPEGNEFCVLEPRPYYGETGALAAIVQDCPDPVALAPFWSAASGWPIFLWRPHLAVLRPPGGRGPWLALVRTAEPKRVKQRIHIDVSPFTGEDHAAEVSRLIDLGAAHADVGQGDVPWAVMTDPQGNEFCVLTPR
ncbi:MAG TPA: VOC family protein [Actinophytocola sp.]|uniref:VOC family protein n=1 Tax=Actinophytocola sp. TaxID=1872138 RepID=UPI002DDCD458|nr:VOC family protein [Actinophytocola sp.]HEV2782972.1 VOC family protein [Actinophytocola sp.]